MFSFNNKIKYKEFHHTEEPIMSDGSSDSSSILDVDTDMLATYGTYLKNLKTTLDNSLDSLETQMALITEGWSDNDGAAFQTKFSSFVKESKKISDEMSGLGQYATTEASKYDTILEESVRMMGED